MKTIWSLLALAVLLPTTVLSQQSELPLITRWEYASYDYWPEADITTQTSHWENGNINVQYEDLGTGKRLRKAYYESGNLWYTVEVTQTWHDDTAYTEDLISGEMTINDSHGYYDTWDGKFIEYEDSKYTRKMTVGYFANDKMVGEWQKIYMRNYPRESSHIALNYNERGEPYGTYHEYYGRSIDDREHLMWTGIYEPRVYYINCTDIYGTEKKCQKRTSEKMGTWEHYDKSGELLQVVTYEWKK